MDKDKLAYIKILADKAKLDKFIAEDDKIKSHLITISKTLKSSMEKIGTIEKQAPEYFEKTKDDISKLSNEIEVLSKKSGKELSDSAKEINKSIDMIRRQITAEVSAIKIALSSDIKEQYNKISEVETSVAKIGIAKSKLKDGNDGKDGSDGRGIENAYIENGKLILVFTDGTEKNLGTVVSENTPIIRKGGGQANVQADWNAIDGDAFIKNKPTIGSGGHTIQDATTTFTDRTNLKFTGSVTVTDDAGNDVTTVDVTGGGGLVLGELSTNAYYGDKGKTAYDHSQTAHAPVDAEKNVQADWNQVTNTEDDYIKNKPTIPVGIPANGASTQIVQYASAGTGKWATISGDGALADGGALSVNKTRLNIRNETGSTIATTKAVYVSGFNNLPLVGLASNTDETKHNVVGVTVGAISHEANGYIATSGQFDAETNSYSAVGVELYLSTSGALVETAPTTGDVQHIGIVTVKENYPTGKILLYRQPETYMVTSPASIDVVVRMGDSAGTNKTSFRDYANSEVASINSDGLITGTLVKANIESALTGSITSHLHPASRFRMRIIEDDFLTANLNAFNGMLGAALSSGTVTQITPVANHMGIMGLTDSTTANGGYRIMTDATSMLIAGGEKAIFVFSDVNTTGRATASFRMGFQDSTTIQTAPTDGVWIGVSGGVATGYCKNNAGPTNTASTYTLTNLAWYTATIELNSDATLATFKIFSEAGAEVWSDTVNANIPSGAGRYTGFGIIAGETTTDAAANICYIDYVSLEINRTLVR